MEQHIERREMTTDEVSVGGEVTALSGGVSLLNTSWLNPRFVTSP